MDEYYLHMIDLIQFVISLFSVTFLAIYFALIFLFFLKNMMINFYFPNLLAVSLLLIKMFFFLIPKFFFPFQPNGMMIDFFYLYYSFIGSSLCADLILKSLQLAFLLHIDSSFLHPLKKPDKFSIKVVISQSLIRETRIDSRLLIFYF